MLALGNGTRLIVDQVRPQDVAPVRGSTAVGGQLETMVPSDPAQPSCICHSEMPGTRHLDATAQYLRPRALPLRSDHQPAPDSQRITGSISWSTDGIVPHASG